MTRQNSKRNTPNSMTTKPRSLIRLWRPNNYRRQIRFKWLSNSGVKKCLTTIPNAKQNSHTKIVTIKDYVPNITIQLGKDYLTVIWKQDRFKGVKKWYEINAANKKDVDTQINNKKSWITSLMDSAADQLVKQIPIKLVGVFTWSRYEDALKGDSFLDGLPRDAIIHSDHFKKVYADNVEFIGGADISPTAKMVQYINNRVVEQFTPEIAKEIGLLRSKIDSLIVSPVNVGAFIEANIKVFPEDVYKHCDVILSWSDDVKLRFWELIAIKRREGVL